MIVSHLSGEMRGIAQTTLSMVRVGQAWWDDIKILGYVVCPPVGVDGVPLSTYGVYVAKVAIMSIFIQIGFK